MALDPDLKMLLIHVIAVTIGGCSTNAARIVDIHARLITRSPNQCTLNFS